MSLPDNALVTVAQARTVLKDAPAGDDAMLETLIGTASSVIENYCGRQFSMSTQRTFRTVPVEGPRLCLPNAPIRFDAQSRPIAVTLGSETLTDFEIEDSELGWLWRDGGWGGYESDNMFYRPVQKASLVVTYNAGWALPFDAYYTLAPAYRLPVDIQNAALATVVSLYRQRGWDKQAAAIDTENQAIGRQVYGVIPSRVIPLLKPYVRGF